MPITALKPKTSKGRYHNMFKTPVGQYCNAFITIVLHLQSMTHPNDH